MSEISPSTATAMINCITIIMPSGSLRLWLLSSLMLGWANIVFGKLVMGGLSADINGYLGFGGEREGEGGGGGYGG